MTTRFPGPKKKIANFVADNTRSAQMNLAKHIHICLVTIALTCSCGFDKLHDDISADFYLVNATKESIEFSLWYYTRLTSQIMSQVSLTVESGARATIFEGLGFNGSCTKEDVFNYLAGDVREDTRVELKINTGDISVIIWSPNDSLHDSFFKQSNWAFEEVHTGNMSHMIWSFTVEDIE